MSTATMENGVIVRRVGHAELRREVADAVAEMAGLTIEEFERLGQAERLDGQARDLWRLLHGAVIHQHVNTGASPTGGRRPQSLHSRPAGNFDRQIACVPV